MKKFIYGIFTAITMTTVTSAQISIGGKQTVEGTSTLLDFNSTATGKKATDTSVDNTYGIILPAIDINNVATLNSANNGTFLFDIGESKVKMYENNVWLDLTDSGNSSAVVINTSTESANSQGAIIGSTTSNAKGVLVLESPDKALILPRITDPHLNVKSPYPGMMCYDVASKSLAVFDGIFWYYWK